MLLKRTAPLTLAALTGLGVLLVMGLLQLSPSVSALPPAGTDVLKVAAEIDVTSRIGSETILLTGTATIDRQDPILDNGVEVSAAEMTALNLSGTSSVGTVTVIESPTLQSLGEIRSLQPPPDQFPASSFFDVLIQATVPASGGGNTIVLRNQMPLHVVNQTDVTGWPPTGLTWAGDQSGSGNCGSPPFQVSPPPGGGILLLLGGNEATPNAGWPACVYVTHVSISILSGTATPSLTPMTSPTRTPTSTRTATATRTPTMPPVVVGDADCLNGITSVDALIILQFIADLLNSLPCPDGADADQNTSIDAIDSLLILQYVVGLLDTLPPNAQPTHTPTTTPTRTATPTRTGTPSPTSTFTPPGGNAVVALQGCVDNNYGRRDDFSEGPIALPFTGNFLGKSLTDIYVNNNGNVTFDGAFVGLSSTGSFKPPPLDALGRVIIAPFLADVDTFGAGSSVVTYGATMYEGHDAFCVNWYNVGYYDDHDQALNQVQLLLVDRSDVAAGDFDIIMNYDQVDWETGDASNGAGGVGGSSARAGYASGGTFYEIAGSGIAGCFLDSDATNGLIHNELNSGVMGRYIFEARSGVAPTVVDTPLACLGAP